MSPVAYEALSELVRLTLAFILLPALLTKARSPSTFVAAVKGYGVGGRLVTTVLALSMAAAEVLVLVLLLHPAASARVAMAAAGCLFAAFSAGAAVIHRRHPDVPCGCLGAARLRVTGSTVALNAVVTFMALAVAVGAASVPAAPATALGTGDSVALGLIAVMAAFTYWLAHYAGSLPYRPARNPG